MPGLNTTLHIDMWREYKNNNSLLRRLRRAASELRSRKRLYGLDWGDPEVVPPLRFLRNRFLETYVNDAHDAVEIGPGGGRWTRYMLGFRKLYVVDYHDELLREVQRNFGRPNMTFVKNNGFDFPGIPDRSIDFLFSFGCFVHLDAELIAKYLESMRRILKPAANAVIHYSDKNKAMACVNPDFSNNTPDRMREMVLSAGFRVAEEDLTTMWNGGIIRFTP